MIVPEYILSFNLLKSFITERFFGNLLKKI
jgi:hypothetical protein